MRGMNRREFFSLSLGVAGLSAVARTDAFANPKTLLLAQPNNSDLAYINVTTAPYNFRWSPIQADFGQGSLTALAFSGSGAVVWSRSINLFVTNLPSGISVP